MSYNQFLLRRLAVDLTQLSVHTMAYATRPCRQLNNNAIRGAALCHIPPAFDGRCSIVTVKAVWRVQGGTSATEQAWQQISAKRMECDESISSVRGIAFYYSAVSTFESRQPSKREKDTEDLESSEDEEGTPPSSQVVSSDGKKKKLHPAVSYWIAIQSPNGAPVSPRAIHSALTKCDMEIFPQRTSKSSDKEISALCQILKDHKNAFIGDLVDTSYNSCYTQTIENISDCAEIENYLIDPNPVGTDKVVHLHVVDQQFYAAITAATDEMAKAGLQLHTFGVRMSSESANAVLPRSFKPLASPITILCNDIETLMNTLGYRCHRGSIFRKNPECFFTYSYRGTMKSFLHKCASNDSMKDRLVRHMSKLLPILSDPDCEVLPTIKIDYDLIEVSDGWFWSFSRGRFVQDALSKEMVGQVSPRTFLHYDHSNPQDPKFFREILENSLEAEQVSRFCADFLRLFGVNQKQHKEKVPCLIGESGSGKTSLFFPVLAIVKPQAIAKVTKQKCFNKSMIGPDTQVIFLDEASEATMDVDDWKTLTQGGFTAHDCKYAKSRGYINKCPMLITCQREMQFNDEDRKAMDARLNKYFFKSLPSLNQQATKWIKTHAMDCIVWAQNKASALRAGHSEDGDVVTDSSSDEMQLDEEEVAAIRELLIVKDSEHEMPTVGETSQIVAAGEQQESIEEILREWDEDSDLVRFHNELSKRLGALGDERNLRWQILVAIKKNFDGYLRQTRVDQQRQVGMARRSREQGLIDLGVQEDLLHRMPDDPTVTYPATLQQAVDKCVAQMNTIREADRRTRATDVFQDTWLLSKEYELLELVKEIKVCVQRDVRQAKEYCLSVASDALKLHHKSTETDPEIGLEMRRQAYVKNGWIAKGQEACLTDLHSPPNQCILDGSDPEPSREGVDGKATDSSSSIHEVLPELPNNRLLTPPSSQRKSQRKRMSATQQKAAKGQKTLHHFFSKSQN